MRSAATQFDAAIAYAQSLAATSGNGATLVFDRRTGADGAVLPGFTMTVYAGRPTAAGAIRNAPMPPVPSSATISEAKVGSVPFTVFLDGAGHASVTAGAASVRTVLDRDPGCPAGEDAVTLTLQDPRSAAVRTLACNAPVAGPS